MPGPALPPGRAGHFVRACRGANWGGTRPPRAAAAPAPGPGAPIPPAAPAAALHPAAPDSLASAMVMGWWAGGKGGRRAGLGGVCAARCRRWPLCRPRGARPPPPARERTVSSPPQGRTLRARAAAADAESGMSFFQRVLNHLVNQVLVEGLANK